MKHKIKTVAVYCGHEFGLNPAFVRDAGMMGELIAKNGLNMVFGGGDVGLMGTVSSAAINNGGHVIGISTKHAVARQEPAHDKIDVKIVDGINERKQKMIELSDAFIVMPGGIGTLNEATDILTMQQIGEVKKPIFFLNTLNFWEPLYKLVWEMQRQDFVDGMRDYIVIIGDTPEEIIEKILNY